VLEETGAQDTHSVSAVVSIPFVESVAAVFVFVAIPFEEAGPRVKSFVAVAVADDVVVNWKMAVDYHWEQRMGSPVFGNDAVAFLAALADRTRSLWNGRSF